MSLDWSRLENVAIRASSLPLAAVLLLPAGLLVRHLVTLPAPQNTWKVSPGLKSLKPGPVKDRVEQVYPEDALGTAQYVDLPFGKTKFAISGPAEGRKIVLIHGFSTPSIIFKEVLDCLVSEGFLVLTFDLYGRGYSDAPEHLTLPLYTTQIALLMQHVGWSKARIVGLSMGGGIATSFVAQFPNLVDGDVALLAPAGNFRDSTIPLVTRIFTSPLVSWLQAAIMRWMPLPRAPHSFKGAVLQMMAVQAKALPHYVPVLMWTARYGPIRGCGPAYTKLGASSFRVMVVHGTADVVVPYHPYMSPILMDYLPKAKMVTLEDVGHDLAFTHSERVAKELVDFFNHADAPQ